MLTQLLHRPLISFIEGKYPSLNARIVLSAFIFKNFKMVCTSELKTYAKEICVALLQNSHDVVYSTYPLYFSSFVSWRSKDIEQMKGDINMCSSQLAQMVIKEPKDEADVQWNDGIARNITVMHQKMEVLEELSERVIMP